jgi:hypothetical protein
MPPADASGSVTSSSVASGFSRVRARNADGARIAHGQPLNSLIYQSRRDKLTPLLDHKLRKFG